MFPASPQHNMFNLLRYREHKDYFDGRRSGKRPDPRAYRNTLDNIQRHGDNICGEQYNSRQTIETLCSYRVFGGLSPCGYNQKTIGVISRTNQLQTIKLRVSAANNTRVSKRMRIRIAYACKSHADMRGERVQGQTVNTHHTHARARTRTHTHTHTHTHTWRHTHTHTGRGDTQTGLSAGSEPLLTPGA